MKNIIAKKEFTATLRDRRFVVAGAVVLLLLLVAGASVYLEGHRHNEAKFSQAENATSLIRFGEMTSASNRQITRYFQDGNTNLRLVRFRCRGAF